MSWEDAWQAGRTGWDAGRSAPALEELLESDVLPTGRAFVPGCGAGYDVLALARDGSRDVTGLDVAPTAKARFEALRAESGVSPERARVVVDDFFTHSPEAPYALLWDYTFLCAIAPDRRAAWAHAVDRLVAPDGELVTLIFPATDAETSPFGKGPPHPLRPEQVRALLTPRWRAVELRRVTESHPGREGLEWLGRWRRA